MRIYDGETGNRHRSYPLYSFTNMIRRIGVLLIMLAIAGVLYTGCKKGDDTSAGKADPYDLSKRYKDTLQGTWTFQHFISKQYHGQPMYDTVFRYSDTSIGVTAPTDSTIGFGTDLLIYSDSIHYCPGFGERIDTNTSVHYWKKGLYKCNTNHTLELKFNRLNDSLYLSIDVTGGALSFTMTEIYRTLIKH